MTNSTRLDKRRFLMGSTGAVLALPFLPSLFASKAAAQAVAGQKSFVHMLSQHGAIYQSRMFPDTLSVTETQNYAGFAIRRSLLAATKSGGVSRVSDIMRVPSADLSDSVVCKMNVINGIDVPFYIGHNRSQGLGNFADSDQAEDAVKAGAQRMTVDQHIAWSPNFYQDLSHVRERAIVFGEGSWAYSSPSARTGTLQQLPRTASSNLELFDKLFGTTTTAAKPLLVDQVLESYKTLRDGNVRLSAEDKRRLTEHMDRIYELQRKLKLAAGAPVTRPNTDSNSMRLTSGYEIAPYRQVAVQQLMNDIVVAAFSANVSRVCVTSPSWGENLVAMQEIGIRTSHI